MATLDKKAMVRRRSKLRKDSSSEISIEELLPDDMGYDADIEALHPDAYEEPESEAEVSRTPKRKFHSIDDELAARMKHLGSEKSGTNSPMTPSSIRGRKRRSLHDEFAPVESNEPSELEVMEVPVADRAAKSPPKKRRRRSKPGSSSHMSDASLGQNAPGKPLYITNDTNDANDAMDLA